MNNIVAEHDSIQQTGKAVDGARQYFRNKNI